MNMHLLQFLEFGNFIKRSDLVKNIVKNTHLFDGKNTPVGNQKKMEAIFIALPILQKHQKYLAKLLMDPGSVSKT